MNDDYITYPHISYDDGEEVIIVSFTPSNGHRIQILNGDSNSWASFDFRSVEDIETIANQLLDIAKRDH